MSYQYAEFVCSFIHSTKLVYWKLSQVKKLPNLLEALEMTFLYAVIPAFLPPYIVSCLWVSFTVIYNDSVASSDNGSNLALLLE